MDSPDRNRFGKLALYHNHSWWPQAIAQGLVPQIAGSLVNKPQDCCLIPSAEHPPRVDYRSAVISKTLDWDHAWGLPGPPRLIISMAVFSTAAVRFLRRFAFGRSR